MSASARKSIPSLLSMRRSSRQIGLWLYATLSLCRARELQAGGGRGLAFAGSLVSTPMRHPFGGRCSAAMAVSMMAADEPRGGGFGPSRRRALIGGVASGLSSLVPHKWDACAEENGAQEEQDLEAEAAPSADDLLITSRLYSVSRGAFQAPAFIASSHSHILD